MKYKIIVDKQSRTNPSSEKREYEVDIEELRFKGDVYDSLIVTKDENYVMRKLRLTEFYVLEELEEPIKQPLENVNIELFEGDNYIYLEDKIGNNLYAEYLVKNEFNDIYARTAEMTALIEMLSQSILLEVNKKVDNKDYTSAQILLKINNDISSAKISADKIDLTATNILNLLSNNELNLSSRNMSITSTNFNVDKDGNVVISADEDSTEGKNPSFKIQKDANNYTEFYAKTIRWFHNGFETMRFQPSFPMIFFRKQGDGGMAIWHSLIRLEDATNQTEIRPFEITTPKLTQTSLADKKKNLEKFNSNAIDIINQIELYKYNLKGEKDEDKKHIGFIIGDDYKYSKEVTSNDNTGVDLYSFVSVCCKAIQEQQEQINKLQNKIEELEARR